MGRVVGLLALALALGLMALAAWQVYESPNALSDRPGAGPTPPATESSSLLVDVRRGETAGEIGQRLEEMGIIDSALHFRILVSLLGYDGLLQAGTYEFSPNTSVLTAVQRIRHGRLATHTLVLIEGWRLSQTARAVEELGIATAEQFQATAVAGRYYDAFPFLRPLPPEAPLEGYLFPATYTFPRNVAVEEVVRAMLAKLDETFTPELRQEAERQGLNMHQVLTIASIVEREARLPEERPVIAQVFLKRLRLGIPLEADPTVQYALGLDERSVAQHGFWKAPLTLQDLEVDSPYNTYRNQGLPPGPIASPGLDSIVAVVRPAGTNYLYFVARPDGSHAFAETLEEHLRNVQMYRD
ncbi:Endolytic murein transglycosylase [bacterium HR25]|jgi:UPF0755 protein|nr:Endolytic murein transglycosylase [bacterium HR25]